MNSMVGQDRTELTFRKTRFKPRKENKMKYEEIVKNYAEQKIKEKGRIGVGRVFWKGTNLFCDGDKLYSYGHHHSLAKFIGVNEKNVFLKNGDQYDTGWRNSQSTNSHIALTDKYCDGPTASFTALDSAGIRIDKVVLDNIIDFSAPDSISVYRDLETGKFLTKSYEQKENKSDKTSNWEEVMKPWKKPTQGMFIPSGKVIYNAKKKEMNGDYREDVDESKATHTFGHWHVIGGCLMKYEGEYYLCALDEGRYFVSQLPCPSKTIPEAFESLKPKEVRDAEERGVKIKRQGEWFFVPFGKTDKGMAQFHAITQKFLRKNSGQRALPKKELDSNEHVCVQFQPNGVIYARGTVYHRNPITYSTYYSGEKMKMGGESTGEHQSLKIGEEWHVVFRNIEKASWSVDGNVD